MTAATSTALGRDARVIGLVTAAHFMSHFYQLVLPPVFVLMTAEYGLSYIQLGLLVTVFSVMTGVVQTPMGFVVDRFGGRPMLIGGLLLLSVSIGLYGLAPSYEWLLLFAAIGGIANSVFHPADFAILSGSVEKRRIGRAFSIHAVAGNLGWAAAPLVMLSLTAVLDLRTAFLVVGGVGVLVVLLLVAQYGHLRDENDRRGAGGARNREGQSLREGLGLLLSRTAMLLFMFQMVYAMAFGGIRNFSLAAVTEISGTPVELVAGALTGYLVGASFGNLLGGWLVDRTGRPHVIFTVSILATSAIMALVGLVAMPIAFLTVAFIVAGTLQGSLLPPRDVLVRELAPPGQIGKMFGFTSSGLSLGNAITPLVFGWVMDNADPRWIFYGSAICMLLALATYTHTTRGRRA